MSVFQFEQVLKLYKQLSMKLSGQEYTLLGNYLHICFVLDII